MKTEFIIRNAKSDDIPYITSFLRKMMLDEMENSGGYPVSSNENEWKKYIEIIKKNFTDKDFIYKIAESTSRKQIVGVSEAKVTKRHFVYKPAPTLHIHSLYVEKGSRRKGIGKALLEAVLEWGRDKQCQEAELDVFVNNSAKALYEQLGFRPFELKMVRKM